MDRDASRAAARRRSLPVTKAIIGVDSRHFALSEINVGYAAPVQGPLVVRARTAIASYEVEMVPVVVHHRIAHVHAFTDGLTAPELTRASKAGTELIAVFRWVQNKERSLNGQI